MPLSQLVRKLAGRDSPGSGTTQSGLDTGASESETTLMGCDALCRYSVVAEVVPIQDGGNLPCNPGNSTSSQERSMIGAFAGVPHALHATGPNPSVLGGSLPSSLSTSSAHPATARAIRARGKAMLRSSTLGAGEKQPSPGLCNMDAMEQPTIKSMDQLDSSSRTSSSSSMEAQLGHMSLSPASNSYQRSTTAALPTWAQSLTQNTSTNDYHKAPAEAAAPAATAVQHAPSHGELVTAGVAGAAATEGLGDPPMSPGSAAACDAFWYEDCELHCDWEDGVVASWLTGMDHPKLLEMLHSVEEPEVAAQQPSHLTPLVSHQAVYSSSLYT